MKYKVGDKVRIKSLDWYNENKDEYGYIDCGSRAFFTKMSALCGKVATIKEVCKYNCYRLEEYDFDWTDEMIERLVEEDNVHSQWTGLKVELELSKSVIGVSNVESLHGERFMSGFVKAIIPPEGYIFKDENGNEILTSKIILEKKKKEYPKTYEECRDLIEGSHVEPFCADLVATGYLSNLMERFARLIMCRDAYWKIAGDEMGLDKSWEPDWNTDVRKYCIGVLYNRIQRCDDCIAQYIFAFPTEEMRDAFYENFKKEIESCKEFL